MTPTPDNKNISTDIEKLSQHIALPVRPSEAIWQQEVLGKQNTNVPGPTDYRLTAVLRYDASDVQALLQKVGPSTREAETRNVEVEAWFPDEVKKLARDDDGVSTVEGYRYEADAFLRSPYSSGKLIRAGQTNYFVLKILSF